MLLFYVSNQMLPQPEWRQSKFGVKAMLPVLVIWMILAIQWPYNQHGGITVSHNEWDGAHAEDTEGKLSLFRVRSVLPSNMNTSSPFTAIPERGWKNGWLLAVCKKCHPLLWSLVQPYSKSINLYLWSTCKIFNISAVSIAIKGSQMWPNYSLGSPTKKTPHKLTFTSGGLDELC